MGVAKNDDLGRMLVKEIQRTPVQSQMHYREVQEQQIKRGYRTEPDAKRQSVRPCGACRIHISPDVNRRAYFLQFLKQLRSPDIPCVENEPGTVLLEDGKQSGMGPPVGIGKDGNKVMSRIGQFDGPGNVSLVHLGDFLNTFWEGHK
jgi:hypothetical protein